MDNSPLKDAPVEGDVNKHHGEKRVSLVAAPGVGADSLRCIS
jgi:hypothetical protein